MNIMAGMAIGAVGGATLIGISKINWRRFL